MVQEFLSVVLFACVVVPFFCGELAMCVNLVTILNCFRRYFSRISCKVQTSESGDVWIKIQT